MKLNPPRVYQSFIAAMLVISLLLPSTRIIAYPYYLLGIPLFALGAYWALSSKQHFKRTGTPIAVLARPEKLHQDRLFRYSRNPMYLGIATALFGLCAILQSFVNGLFPLLFIVLMDRYVISEEEKNLLAECPDEYTRYQKKVRRWI